MLSASPFRAVGGVYTSSEGGVDEEITSNNNVSASDLSVLLRQPGGDVVRFCKMLGQFLKRFQHLNYQDDHFRELHQKLPEICVALFGKPNQARHVFSLLLTPPPPCSGWFMGDLSMEQTQELHRLLRPGGLLYKTLEGVSLYRKDLLYEILPDKLPPRLCQIFNQAQWDALPLVYRAKLDGVAKPVPPDGSNSSTGIKSINSNNPRLKFDMVTYFTFCMARMYYNQGTQPRSSPFDLLKKDQHYQQNKPTCLAYQDLIQAYLDYFLPSRPDQENSVFKAIERKISKEEVERRVELSALWSVTLSEFWLVPFTQLSKYHQIDALQWLKGAKMLVQHLVKMELDKLEKSSFKSTPIWQSYMGAKRAAYQAIHERLFLHVNSAFNHSIVIPLNQLNLLIETWLVWITPWNFEHALLLERDSNDENEEELEEGDKKKKVDFTKWKSFMMDNLAYYSILLRDFLKRATRFEYSEAIYEGESHPYADESRILNRVMRKFKAEAMIQTLIQIEMAYLEASKPSTSPQSSIIIVSASPGIQAGSLSELMVKQVNAFLNEHQQYEPAFAGSDKELPIQVAMNLKQTIIITIEALDEKDPHWREESMTRNISSESTTEMIIRQLYQFFRANREKLRKIRTDKLRRLERSFQLVKATFYLTDEDCQLDAGRGLSGGERDLYAETSMMDPLLLTPRGKFQVKYGLRKCAIKGVRPIGADLKERARSYEYDWMLRITLILDHHYQENLRWLAERSQSGDRLPMLINQFSTHVMSQLSFRWMARKTNFWYTAVWIGIWWQWPKAAHLILVGLAISWGIFWLWLGWKKLKAWINK